MATVNLQHFPEGPSRFTNIPGRGFFWAQAGEAQHTGLESERKQIREDARQRDGKGRTCQSRVHRRNTLNKKNDEASEWSRESVCSQLTMSDTVGAKGDVEAQRRETACASAQREQTIEGARDRISAGVVEQSVEGNGMDSLWRVLGVVEGGQDCKEEATKVRKRVVPTVEERWQAGQLEEQLSPGETGWQGYIQMMQQGRRMGGPPGVWAWVKQVTTLP